MSYVLCAQVAKTFLADVQAQQREDYLLLVEELAQRIQDSIEDFIDEKWPTP